MSQYAYEEESRKVEGKERLGTKEIAFDFRFKAESF